MRELVVFRKVEIGTVSCRGARELGRTRATRHSDDTQTDQDQHTPSRIPSDNTTYHVRSTKRNTPPDHARPPHRQPRLSIFRLVVLHSHICIKHHAEMRTTTSLRGLVRDARHLKRKTNHRTSTKPTQNLHKTPHQISILHVHPTHSRY